jgi:hypothetical protein
VSFQKELALTVVADEELNANEEVVFVRAAVAEFMPHMRFVEMGHVFIQNRVRQSGLVPESMVLDVVMKMMHGMASTLQPGCKRAFADEEECDAGTKPAKKTPGRVSASFSLFVALSSLCFFTCTETTISVQ